MGLSIVKQNYISYIDNIIKNNKISHSYLVELDNYDDDFDLVISFIKMILCNVTYEEIDSNDPIVSLIDSNNYPDLFILEPDGNTFRKSQLMDLQKEFQNSSLLDGKRIYVIKNVEKFNASSANSILKFLEEPEDNIIAFLLTDNRYHVLETILSRCQVLSLKEYCNDIILNDDILNLLSCFVNPSSFFTKYNYLNTNIFIDKDSFLLNINNIENIFLQYLHNYYKVLNSIDNSVFSILKKINVSNILSYISIIEEEKEKLIFNVNFKLFLDSFYSKLILEVI